MILADTSVWVDHLRRGNALLTQRLSSDQIVCHAFVIGELACGNLRDRDRVLADLRRLPKVPEVTNEEVLLLLDHRRLYGRGLGWVDAHLLAASLVGAVRLWTLDRTLDYAARELRVQASV